ncbi:HGGxSTG domain-containing protein [Paenirhodobacter hankyongi]|uniref:Uncharacterized protein n=1 Tax=Paenirhodobacter hankyongi TaxID=2294033 RepID=A0A421BXM1_9RHOB|nr:HGGxSTG domain-containing protein [Sinirhodobacter hankyongi]RLL73045.1 hypothetical protein DYS74_01640 [Sinirhodobacter hankyongi]
MTPSDIAAIIALYNQRRRMKCGARTRKGTPCKMWPEPGKRRCRLHGGLSTGPKTTEGIERIRAAQKRRGAKHHEEHDRGH